MPEQVTTPASAVNEKDAADGGSAVRPAQVLQPGSTSLVTAAQGTQGGPPGATPAGGDVASAGARSVASPFQTVSSGLGDTSPPTPASEGKLGEASPGAATSEGKKRGPIKTMLYRMSSKGRQERSEKKLAEKAAKKSIGAAGKSAFTKGSTAPAPPDVARGPAAPSPAPTPPAVPPKSRATVAEAGKGVGPLPTPERSAQPERLAATPEGPPTSIAPPATGRASPGDGEKIGVPRSKEAATGLTAPMGGGLPPAEGGRDKGGDALKQAGGAPKPAPPQSAGEGLVGGGAGAVDSQAATSKAGGAITPDRAGKLYKE